MIERASEDLGAMIGGDDNAQVHRGSLCYRLRMRILFIDVASGAGLIALCTQDAVIALKKVDRRIRDDELVRCFEKMLKKEKWKPETLTHITCVIGPGGFTSLRVGVAFGNALSWSLKIPISGIHLSDLYAARVILSSVEGCHGSTSLRQGFARQEGLTMTRSFLWLHSTKKHELFVRGFGSYQKKWQQPIHVRLDEIPDNICWVGELLPEHIQKGWRNISLGDIQDVLPGLLLHQHYTNKKVVPWYGREG